MRLALEGTYCIDGDKAADTSAGKRSQELQQV